MIHRADSAIPAVAGATRRAPDLAARARAAFPLLRSVRYLDIATKAPMASPVRVALDRFLDAREHQCGDKAAWKPVVEGVRQKFAALIHARPTEVAIVRNTSDGLNALAHSIRWMAGDNVVLSAAEHPNNLYPWLNVGRRYGVEVRLVPPDPAGSHVARLAESMDARTRAVPVSLVSFMPGARADLEAIGRLCRERGAHLIVDGIQAVGVLQVDVDRLGIDALAAGAHKGLLGPYGVGFLYCRRERLADWDPVYAANASIVAHDGSCAIVEEADFEFQATAARYEVGNYNYEGLHAQEAALDFLRSFDPAEVEAHVLRLSRRFHDGIRALGVGPLSPEADVARSGIVALPAANAANVRDELLRRGTAVAQRGDALRVSFHLFNTDDDVDGALGDVKEVLSL